MGKIAERFVNYMKSKYDKKGLDWNRSDDIIWKFWAYVFPLLAFIPLLFFLMKWFIIDIILAKRGFEEMVAYGIIILIIRPMIMELFTKLLTFRKEIKKNA